MENYIEDSDVPQDPNRRPIGRPKGSHKHRMTQIERRRFINESIREIMNNHLSYTEYVEYCKGKDISKPQANEYWISCWNVIKKKFELEKDKLILKHTQKYWDIYAQAIEQRDLTNARQSLNDLAKLQGLNEPDKVHITGTSIKLNFGEPDDSQ
jgi:leucyl aminopeptidase (aminopeptidase T)